MRRAATQLRSDLGRFGTSVLSGALREARAWIANDLAACEEELSSAFGGSSIAERGARHLIELGGKRLRPLCVLVAAKLGRGVGRAARDLAVAAEMIHGATLLHDDVVDLGETRRGAPTARRLFGNSGAVLAGDTMLVAALLRIMRAGDPSLLRRALETLEEMVAAEALELEQRGRVDAGRDVYFRVVEGKTASLFRWALRAGGRIGGLPEVRCHALQRYGHHVGVAFQLVDDLLDVAGDARMTGKDLFSDLREGKMTLPLLLAVEREPGLAALFETALARGESPARDLVAPVRRALDRTGAIRDTRKLARSHAASAVDSLEGFEDGPGRRALVTVAKAVVDRGG